MMEQEIMEAINENPVVKQPKFLSFFMMLALVQSDVLLEAVLSVLLNPAAFQSLHLLSVWRMSLMYNWADFSLKRYSVIILDEVHERSLHIEILIGMLSAIIGIRQKLYEDQQKLLHERKSIVPEKCIFPLKLLLMSATMPVEDFRKLFPDPPQVINVLSRQFKVNTHFSATTEGDINS